jgi:AraC-like DNA-binding protein
MGNDEKPHYSQKTRTDVHRLPGGIGDIHRKYGMWIISASCGLRAPVNGFHSTRKRVFEFYSLSHMTEGRGRLWLPPNREYNVEPGWAILITPNSQNCYGGANGQPYVEDSIRFCGPVVDMMRAAGILSDGLLYIGQARKIVAIAEMVSDPAAASQINANIALQRLLVELYNDRRRRRAVETPSFEAVANLLDEIKARFDRWWTLDEMASYCDLSVEQFRRVFRRRVGMNPKQYLDQARVNRAIELLLSSPMSVGEIAAELGYLDPYHFSRRFKQLTGISPDHYRQRYLQA